MKRKGLAYSVGVLKMVIGCALFGLGVNLFLAPNGLNAGGISGLSMSLVHLLNFGTVGSVTALINLPLFDTFLPLFTFNSNSSPRNILTCSPVKRFSIKQLYPILKHTPYRLGKQRISSE